MSEVWTNEVALVTGAGGAIGAAIALGLREKGAKVAASDLTAALPGIHLDRVDVTDARAVDTWVRSTAEALGTPTIGVICAGISRSGRLVDTSDEDWRHVVDVNLTGAFFTARALIRSMVAAGKPGRLVFVGSWAGHAPHPHIGAYSASKAGLRVLAQTLALDHARDGILVNEVAPGIVDAGLSRALFRQDSDLEQRTRAAIPLQRILTPEDVARDVLFLASPANRTTTGTVLVSDGGLSLASVMNPGR